MKINAISILFVLLSATPFTNAQAPTKTLVTFEGKYFGCASVFVYRASEDKKRAVIVEADRSALNLSETPQTFDIASSEYLKVYIDEYAKANQWWEYCSDEVDLGASKPTRIPATSGKVTIYISKNPEPTNNYLYKVTVELKDVSFKPTGDNFYYLEKTEMKNVLVGWLPG
ncbi:MAG TPA: hypothetical protein VKB86_19870 [Pyrinomonadaceae bacterium]|nr:hypothetical protein [Pyrinomonadaceae bacterium]